MKKGIFEIISNREIARNTYEMVLTGDTSGISRPGQFVNIELEGFYLRRPISVCDWTDGSLTIIYKAVGRGTRYMAELAPGAELDILSGLGNGYNTELSGEKPLLIGGGAGVPPMYALAKKLVSDNKQVSVILGFNSSDEVFYEDKFAALGTDVKVTTADGSYGIKGFVTDAMDLTYSHTYACGPEPMLRAVYAKSTTGGQYSFEERMGCGFGACMGCSCKTKYGNKRICKDGPVLTKEEIIW
ncbi:MAG: dihydroorotate dehydrogenase electron transfer subunit [Oscillospiraceae bacterium]